MRRGARPVLLARLNRHETEVGAGAGASFTDRLVAKFGLPVAGWRGGPGAVPPGQPGGGRAATGEQGTVAPGQAAGKAAGKEEASRADA